jgi:DNA-binding NarL/FixJ family response regulator
MDIELPGIDGIETTARIRSLNNTARILMVTNYDEPMLRERSQRAGAEGYFLKSNILEVLDYLVTVRPTIHLN